MMKQRLTKKRRGQSSALSFRRILAGVLTLCMLVTMLPGAGLTAGATENEAVVNAPEGNVSPTEPDSTAETGTVPPTESDSTAEAGTVPPTEPNSTAEADDTAPVANSAAAPVARAGGSIEYWKNGGTHLFTEELDDAIKYMSGADVNNSGIKVLKQLSYGGNIRHTDVHFTLDLNGYTVSSVYANFQNSSVIVMDSSVGGGGKITNDSDNMNMFYLDNTVFTLKSGTLENTSCATIIEAKYSSACTIEGGTIKLVGQNNRFSLNAIYTSAEANTKFKMSGGTVESSANAPTIELTVGTNSITGGTITNKGEYAAVMLDGGATVNISGGTLSGKYAVSANVGYTGAVGLSGTPSLKGKTADVGLQSGFTIKANIDNAYYSGDMVNVDYLTEDQQKGKILVTGLENAAQAKKFTWKNPSSNLCGVYNDTKKTLSIGEPLTTIAITTKPKKTAYRVGETFDPAGMVVTASYGSDKSAVTNYTVTPAGPLKLADTDVTVSYTEGAITKTATQAITVKDLPVPAIGDFVYTAPTDLIYNNQAKSAAVTAKSTATGMGAITIRYYDEANKEVSPTTPGTYKVKIDVAEGASYKAAAGLEMGTFEIKYLTTSEVATLSGTKGDNDWYKGTVSINAPTSPVGWTISDNGTEWKSNLTCDTEGTNTVTYYLKDTTEHITDKKTIAVNVDSKAPVITKVEEAPTETTATITVTASDAPSGIAKYELLVEGKTHTKNIEAGTCTFNVDTLTAKKQYEYTVKVTDKAGNAAAQTGNFTTNAKTPSKEDFTYTAPTDLVYTGKGKDADVKVNSGITGMGTITLTYYKDGVETAPIEPGTYNVKLDVAVGTEYSAFTDLDLEQSFTIVYPTTTAAATLEATNKGDAGWYTGNATLMAPADWQISLDKTTWSDEVVWSQEGDFSAAEYYLKDDKGHITDKKTITLKLDKTAPVITEAKADAIKTTTADITVTATDEITDVITSGIVKYTLTAADNTKVDAKSTAGSHTFNLTDLTANTEYIYFVTVQDAAGNKTQKKTIKFTTEKMIINSAAPEITAPVKNGTPVTKATLEKDAHYTAGEVSWSDKPIKFLGGTAYTATVILTPEKDYKFTDATTVEVTGSTLTKTLNADGTLTLIAAFPATEARELSSISVTTNPKTDYTYGDSFDPKGLVLTRTYDDGTMDTVTYSPDNQDEFTFAPEAPKAADKTVTVTHGGKSTTIEITVAKQLVTDPVITPVDYTGTVQKPTIAENPLYMVKKNEGGKDAGNYDVILTLTDSSNYKWGDQETASKTFTFTINQVEQAELNITKQPTGTITYGHAPFTLGTSGGSGEGDVSWKATGSATVDATGKVSIAGANEVTITATKAADKNHKAAVSASYTFTVAKKSLTVTAKDHTITYGDQAAANGVSYEGFVYGETDKVLGGSPVYTHAYQQYADIGNYTITPGGLDSEDYEIQYKTGTLKVEPREAAFVWNNTATRAYDGKASDVTAAVNNLQKQEDDVKVTVNGGLKMNAGTHTAEITGLTGSKAGNYKLPKSGLTQTYTIVQSASEITKIAADQAGYVYGDTMTITATINAAGTEAKEKGLLSRLAELVVPTKDEAALYYGNTQISEAAVVTNDGSCTLTYNTKDKKLPVGTSTLILKYVGNDNMAEATATVNVVLTAKPVTAKAEGTMTKVYDGTDTAEVTLAVKDLINENDEVTVTAPASYKDKQVGTGKEISFDLAQQIVGGTEGAYYEVSMPTGVTGDITAKPLTAAVTAENKVYDGKKEAKLTAAVETGVKGDSLTISGLTGTFADQNAGEKKTVTVNSKDSAVTGLPGTSKDNYTITYPKTVTADITKRPVTVTAADQTKVYGDKDPVFTYTASNLSKDETLKGTLTRKEGEAVKTGGYAITRGTLTDADNPNYKITFQSGTLTVETAEQEALAIQKGPEKVTYGDAPFILKTEGGSGSGAVTWSAAGAAAVNEKGEVTITGAGAVTITATKAADGNHTAAVSAAYQVTVAKKNLTVKAKDNTITYGTEPAGNGVTYTGFVKGDDAGKLSGTLAYEYTYHQFDNVGKDYTITPKNLTSNNYNISYETGMLTVEPLEASFTWNNTDTRAYDGIASNVTATVNNLQNQDQITVDVTGGDQIEEGIYTATITALKGEKAGNYQLPKTLEQDYKIVQSASDITEISADQPGYTYGDVVTIQADIKPAGNAAKEKDLPVMQAALAAPTTNQAALYLGTTQISNAVTVAEDGSCTMSYNTADKLLPMGTSTLTLRYVGTHNMADAVATVNVTIAPKPVTVLAADQTKNYGGKDPAFTYTVTGLEGKDTLTGTLNREEGEDVKDGGYAITQGTLTNANNRNYSITYTPGTLMIQPIAQEALAITGMPVAVTYGDASFTLVTTGGSGASAVTWTAAGPAVVDAAGTVTITGAGEVTITAAKATDGNYTDTVTASATINVAPKALTWDTSALNVITEKHWDGNANAAVSGIVKAAGMVGTDDPGFSYTEAAASYENEKAGSHIITVAVKDANLTNGNYTLPAESITYNGRIISVTQGPNEPWQPDGSGAAHRLVLEKGISIVPDGMKTTVFNTPEKITEEMKRVLSTNPGYTGKNSIVYDVELQISVDGGKTWAKATEENFPAEGLKVRMEYPEGTNANDFNFVVTHMFTSNINGRAPGETESPAVTKTGTYLEFTVTGLSPIAIAWKPVEKKTTTTTTTTITKTATTTTRAPQSGDSNEMMQLVLLLLASGMSMTFVLISRRRKCNK